MTPNLPEAVAAFNAMVKEVEVLLSIARSGELQREACKTLDAQAEKLANEKAKAIAARDEDLANLLLGCQSVNTSLLAELRMYLLLKEEKPDDAWDQLVLAQDGAIDATRAHPGFAHLVQQSAKLEAIEHLVFPPQVFISSGFLAANQECSICSAEYGECDHLLGKPYMGKFCYILARNLSVDHVAIVDSPADKRCRVRSFSVEGGNRNRMTWLVIRSEET
jgi:hypothetical protein